MFGTSVAVELRLLPKPIADPTAALARRSIPGGALGDTPGASATIGASPAGLGVVGPGLAASGRIAAVREDSSSNGSM